MPRRASKTHRREIQPDAVYNNRLVTQLINKVLLDGKKATAERVVYGAFDIVAEKSGEDALTVFKKAMDNIRPTLEVKPKRVVAPPTRCPWRSTPAAPPSSPSAGWSTSRAPARRRPCPSASANEILDASNGVGASVKRREDLFKMAEANRAFSHYRF